MAGGTDRAPGGVESHPFTERSADARPRSTAGGIPDPPRQGMLASIGGLGALWGLVSYSILWEATPVQVGRGFVQSALGTLVLLPSRVVIWAISVAEAAAGRSFDLSANFQWIAPTASLVGAAITFGVALGIRGGIRRWVAPPRERGVSSER
jgi:hypothetical protein